MRTSTSILAILMAGLSHFAHPSLANWTPVKGAQINFYTDTLMAGLSHFAHPSLANWTPVKGAQINFYTDTQCTAYNGEVAAWWDRAPYVGIHFTNSADCITLNMPGNSLSINTARLWFYTTAGTEPAAAPGYCQLYDGFGCTGNMAYTDYVQGAGTCLPSRSVDGWLWKSAKCDIRNLL